MYNPRWQRLLNSTTRADEKARAQYLEGRSMAAIGRIASPSRWLSQYQRDAFLHGYADMRYERGWRECEREHDKAVDRIKSVERVKERD